MTTKNLLIWSAVAIGGYLVYKKFLAKGPAQTQSPITASTQGRGNSAGQPAASGSGTDLQSVANSINTTANTFENTINSAENFLGLGTTQTGTNQAAGNG